MGLEDQGGDDNRPDGPASPWPGEQTPPAKPETKPAKPARKAQTPGAHKPKGKAK